MGRQFSYAHCPQSPTEMPKEPSKPKWVLWATACGLVVALILFFTTLGLYIKQSAECESQPRNHTSSDKGRMTESDALWEQLAAVNRSLENTTEHWATCREELKHSRENTSMLKEAFRQKEEALQRLAGEKTRLQDQLADLKNSHNTLKQERNQKDREIQHLMEQLSERQTSSGAVLLGGPTPSFLLLIVAGLLCSLL